EARPPGHVLEGAITPVSKEGRTLALVRLRRAVRLGLPIDAAIQVGLLAPLDVVDYEQVELAILVVVEPQRARREPGIGHARLDGDVGELAAAESLEQAVAAKRRHVDVRPAVVVEVRRSASHAVEVYIEP